MRPVGERIEAQPARLECLQHFHRLGNLAAQHVRPALVIRRDHLRVVGMTRDEISDGIAPGTPGILPLVPCGRADLGEKTLHRRLVVEQLPVQVTGIPVDQHAAEIEYHDLDSLRERLCVATHWTLLKL